MDRSDTLGPPTGGLPAAPTAFPDRYRPLEVLAEGGWGEIHRVHDTLLDRPVAMKVLRADMADDAVRARFEAEARISAHLQHPGVVPVHDRGVLADGRPWFTMREVHGRTLTDVIEELHLGRPSLERVLSWFLSICQVVDYAHANGVIHRDLKPDNVMVGPYGEVHVLDWGVASPVEPRGPGLQVVGSPAYMAPEQASGELDRHGPHSDVYGLGAILYHILTGAPPYPGPPDVAWRSVRAGAPPPPSSRAPAPIPTEVEDICTAAMTRDPAMRPSSREVHDRIRAWLDGDARRQQAREAVEAVRPLFAEAARLRSEAQVLRREADQLLAGLAPFCPVEQKRPAWRMLARSTALEERAEIVQVDYVEGLREAIRLDPDHGEANDRLAEYLRDALLEAEVAHDGRAAARYARALGRHQGGRHRGWLKARGAVSLRVDDDVEVAIQRYVEHDRVLVLEPVETLGGPLVEHPLDRGSYLLVLARNTPEGRVEVRYPVVVGRGEHWDGVGPDGQRPDVPVVALDGACRVPAGWYQSEGDPLAPTAQPARRRWLEGFWIQRFPVTNAQYLAFIQDLAETGREDLIEIAIPRERQGVSRDGRPTFELGDDGRYRLGTELTGLPLGPSWPVVLIDIDGACAYADWLSAKTGRSWRLPDDLEWEKSMRGVDGRTYPWGNQFDPTFACMSKSSRTPALVDVTDFPVDESPYGVRGGAGNVREICGNPFRDPDAPEDVRDSRVVRGGSWHSTAAFCRLAGRLEVLPGGRLTSLGFRLAGR